MENNNIEKLKLLGKGAVKSILLDAIKWMEDDLGLEAINQQNEELLRVEYMNRILQFLRKKYSSEIKKDKAVESMLPLQTDIETLISQLKSGEVKEWKNNKIQSK